MKTDTLIRKSMTKKALKRAMSNERKEPMPRPTVFADKRYVVKHKEKYMYDM